MVSETKESEAEVDIHVNTWNKDEAIPDVIDWFIEIQESISPLGINFSWKFEDLHDRHIVTDTGWKIKLGRGLDIFEKVEGFFHAANDIQELRLCKNCEITYLKNESEEKTDNPKSIFPEKLQEIIEKNGIKKENILFLRIAGVHLKRIADGSKVVEFRELKDYYLSRLQVKDKNGDFVKLKPLTHILFQGGYNPDSPYMLIEMTDWHTNSAEGDIGYFPEEMAFLKREAEKEGFGPEDEYIGLFLGKILYSQV